MELRFNLSNYGALYAPGGFADQPYSLTRRMNAALNVYQAMKTYRQARNSVEFQSKNPEGWAILEQITMLRQRHGGY